MSDARYLRARELLETRDYMAGLLAATQRARDESRYRLLDLREDLDAEAEFHALIGKRSRNADLGTAQGRAVRRQHSRALLLHRDRLDRARYAAEVQQLVHDHLTAKARELRYALETIRPEINRHVTAHHIVRRLGINPEGLYL